MKERIVCRALPMLLAALLCVTIVLPAAQASTQSEIDALRRQANSISAKKTEVKKKLNSLTESKEEAMARKEALDEQCGLIQEEIDTSNAIISEYDKKIDEKEAEIAETEQKERAQYELFCKRVRTMEEDGNTSYWEFIFKSTSLTRPLMGC